MTSYDGWRLRRYWRARCNRDFARCMPREIFWRLHHSDYLDAQGRYQ